MMDAYFTVAPVKYPWVRQREAPHWDNRSLPYCKGKGVMGTLTTNGWMVAILPSGPSAMMFLLLHINTATSPIPEIIPAWL